MKLKNTGWLIVLLAGCANGEARVESEVTEASVNELIDNVKQQLPMMGRGTLSFYLENDMFTDTDQNYTNGVRISLSSPNLENFDDDFIENEALDRWYDRLNSAFRMLHPASPGSESKSHLSSRRVVLTLGQQIFTPEDKYATELLEDQRPYAGWLYLGTYFHARYGDRLNSVGINLGMVGPASLGQHAQDLIHDIRDIDKFQGWDHQLNNELGVQVVWEKKNKLLNYTNPGMGYDFISHYGASVGNVATYANAGGEFRLGWNIPDNFGTSSLRSGADNHTPDATANDGIGIHAFVSVDGRYVLRDIFLDGNTFSSSHSVDKREWVADGALGLSVVYQNWQFSYARIKRTREFDLQPESHLYGSVSLSWNYQF